MIWYARCKLQVTPVLVCSAYFVFNSVKLHCSFLHVLATGLVKHCQLTSHAEPENTVHNCPDKVSEQVPKCSDILKHGQTLLQC